MKIIVVGCTHTGVAAIKEILKSDLDAEINVYEINDNISFLSCGIALCVGQTVSDINNLFYSSPEEMRREGVNMFMRHKVIDVDVKNKKIKAINLETNEEVIDTYDKLVISTGSWPIIPPFKGIKLDNIHLSKNFKHAESIISSSERAKKVAIIGAGYIGVELAEAFRSLNKDVVLIDLEKEIMGKYFDEKITNLVKQELIKNNIELKLGEKVIEFIGENGKVTKIVTDKSEISADM